MVVFLSHNARDKDLARQLGTNLLLAGAEVWFDEWEIRAGDSIPGRLNEGLGGFSTFLILWSENAARSDWVRTELETALVRGVDDSTIRIVPVRLDDTPLPPMLARFRYLVWADNDELPAIVDEVLGFAGVRERLKAIQQTLDDLYVDVRYFHGYGPVAACPRCGAGVDSIEQWGATDYERDDQYAGARCTECGWEGGGEVW